jgi:hypothetical protein
MLLADESYDNFNYNDINNLSKFNYKFSLNERFIHVKDKDNNYFGCQTPFLKVLKPVHVTLNKKKTVAKKYLILETNDELDFNNQIGEFMFIINKIHEISQEKIKEKSMEWFNTEFDEIGLDIKVKRPIDQQKDNEFIKICIPQSIEDEILKLSKGTYVLCNIIFKGLKISNDYINEEWEIVDLITQEKYDEEQNAELINNSIKVDTIQMLLENNNDENNDNQIVNEENQICHNHSNEDEENTSLNNIIDANISEENINKIEENNQIKDLENNLNNTINTNETKIKKTIKKNKNIGEKIIENKIKNNKNNKKYELIKKLSKKIVFN